MDNNDIEEGFLGSGIFEDSQHVKNDHLQNTARLDQKTKINQYFQQHNLNILGRIHCISNIQLLRILSKSYKYFNCQ
jgi:hypothetical protein